jgi:hypothetical protein
VVSEVVKKYVIFGGGRLMKYEILLRDGSKLRIEDDSVHHVTGDDKNLYSYEFSRTALVPSEEKKKAIDSYFLLIGDEEKKKISDWLKVADPQTKKQEEFLSRIKFAIERVPYTFKIATLEPSLTKEGKIFYKPDGRVGRGISYMMWDIAATNFYYDEEWSSGLGSPEEGDLFIAYRVACGMWSLGYVCDDSSSAGNYWDSPRSNHNFEHTGARLVGGFKDGIGNTLKIFKDASTFIVFGGDFIDSGDKHPVASVNSVSYNPRDVNYRGCGIVVLRKV